MTTPDPEILRRVENAERALAEAKRMLAEAQKSPKTSDPCRLTFYSVAARLKDPEDPNTILLVEEGGHEICLSWNEAAHLIPVLRRYIARGGVSEKGEEVLP